MRSIAELAGKRTRRSAPHKIPHEWPLPNTLMGIEVEVEAYRGVTLPSDLVLWQVKSDGSLQNGKEYVLGNPMAGDELRTAINELLQDSTFVRSMTGSTHIHMDMLEESDSADILRVLVMMVYILEPMLYAAGDRGREWCGFANKLMTGPDELLSVVMDDGASPATFRDTYSRNTSSFGRYYGMNMAALIDYGSLEFRYFPTATKEEELISWVELVQSFKKAARDIGTLNNLDNIIENESRFREFLNTYFSKWSHLFESLGDFHMLRNDYRKAHITSKLRAPKINNTIFTARNVFVDDKYKKLLKRMPSHNESPYIIHRLNGVGSVPVASPGNVLLYRGVVYITPAEGSPILTPPNYWCDLTHVEARVLAQDIELCQALWNLLDTVGWDQEVNALCTQHISRLPRPAPQVDPTTEAPEINYDDPTPDRSDSNPIEVAITYEIADEDDDSWMEDDMEDE